MKTNSQLQNESRLFAAVRAKHQQKHIGETIETLVFGRMVTGKIIAVHSFGTVDLELQNGNCVRVSGIALN
jgi:hypothetical protein